MEKKILVVDDELDDRKKMVTALEKEGYSVMEAASAEETLLKAGETIPHMVIVDVLKIGRAHV